VQCRVEDHPFDEWVAAAVCTLLHKRKFGNSNSLAIAHCIVWELEPLKQNAAFISLIILAMVLQSFELYLVVEKSLGVATCMQDRCRAHNTLWKSPMTPICACIIPH